MVLAMGVLGTLWYPLFKARQANSQKSNARPRHWRGKILWENGGFRSFSPNSVATLRGSYGKCSGPVFNRGCKFQHKCLLWHVHVHCDCAGSHKMLVAGEASGIFPVNFRAKCFLWHVHVHFDCAGSHEMLAAGYVSGIFPVNFLHKMPLVKCPCALRLRRLAQNACRGRSVRHFPCKFSEQIPFVKCPCAFRLRRLTQSVLCGLRIGLRPQHHPPQLHHLPLPL